MEQFTLWFVIVGAVLIFAVTTRGFAQRLSLSTTMLYLGVGVALGPYGYGLITTTMTDGAGLLERLTEIAVIISLFTAGLKLSPPLYEKRWRIALRLAFASMVLTIALITLMGMVLFELPLGAAVLLGAILAPPIQCWLPTCN